MGAEKDPGETSEVVGTGQGLYEVEVEVVEVRGKCAAGQAW